MCCQLVPIEIGGGGELWPVFGQTDDPLQAILRVIDAKYPLRLTSPFLHFYQKETLQK